MKTLILVFGHTGVTKKAAEKLADLLENAEIAEQIPEDLGGYDNYVLGTNVHFGKLNKRFKKCVKKYGDIFRSANTFVYVVGVEVESSDKYIRLAKCVVPFAWDIRYVWGELNLQGATSFQRFFIGAYISGRKGDGLPKPRLLDKEIRSLSESICTRESDPHKVFGA